jgi:hypothetical protein
MNRDSARTTHYLCGAIGSAVGEHHCFFKRGCVGEGRVRIFGFRIFWFRVRERFRGIEQRPGITEFRAKIRADVIAKFHAAVSSKHG